MKMMVMIKLWWAWLQYVDRNDNDDNVNVVDDDENDDDHHHNDNKIISFLVLLVKAALYIQQYSDHFISFAKEAMGLLSYNLYGSDIITYFKQIFLKVWLTKTTFKSSNMALGHDTFLLRFLTRELHDYIIVTLKQIWAFSLKK